MEKQLDQVTLVENLCQVLRERHALHVEWVEARLSYVLLTGEHAYKIKKSVVLDFADFSTLDARRFYCEEELRLNRRCAPGLYLGLVPIGGTHEAPLPEQVPAIEYAVKMREFPQRCQADRMLAEGELTAEHLDALAVRLAIFHRSCNDAAPGSAHGSARMILDRVRDNLAGIRRLLSDGALLEEVDRVQQWCEHEFASRLPLFVQRHVDGYVRECHGDLHLGNIALIDGELMPFDCLEFSEDLRWIDVMDEVAFLVVDLHTRGRPDLAHRFLNAYLEVTGDYAGLAVLRFYVTYRALVRARVALLRARQSPEAAQGASWDEFRRCLALATHGAQEPHPALIVMHGRSGSGKSSVAQGLLEVTGAVRLRSDAERRRLVAGVPNGEQRGGPHSAEMTQATYHHLLALTRIVLAAEYRVIVDAAFLSREQMDMFRIWAEGRGVPFVILSLVAPDALLQQRVSRRGEDLYGAGPVVLDRQMYHQDTLTGDELSLMVTYDATRPLDDARRATTWQSLLGRLERARQSRVY